MLSGRLAEVAAPARLGVGFRWLMASSWTSNLGDGIALAAGPLLVASLTTDDAFLVALAATVQWLPPLLFGLVAGALTDRLDRRLIVVSVDLARAVVLAVLTLAVATDHVSIAAVLGGVVRAQHGRGLRRQQLADPAADARVRGRTWRWRTPGCRPGSSR